MPLLGIASVAHFRIGRPCLRPVFHDKYLNVFQLSFVTRKNVLYKRKYFLVLTIYLDIKRAGCKLSVWALGHLLEKVWSLLREGQNGRLDFPFSKGGKGVYSKSDALTTRPVRSPNEYEK